MPPAGACQPPFSIEFLPSLLRDMMQDVLPTVHAHEDITRCLHSVELFAGEHAITTAFLEEGFQAVAYDKIYDAENQDILTPAGFKTAFSMVMQVRSGGLLFAARSAHLGSG